MTTSEKAMRAQLLSHGLVRGLTPRALVSCLGLGLAWTTACGDDNTTPPGGVGGSGGRASGGTSGKAAGKSGTAGKSSGGAGGPGAGGKGGSGAGKGGSAGRSGAPGMAGSTVSDGGAGEAASAGEGGNSQGGSAGDVTLPEAGAGAEPSVGGSAGASAGVGGVSGSAGEGEAGAGNGGNAAGGTTGDAGTGNEGGEGGEAPVGPSSVQKVFSLSATGPDRFYGITYGADGSIFAVGQVGISNDSNTDLALLLAKFTAEGALDTSFGAGGVVVRNVANGTNGELFRGIVVQSSGKIVASGSIEHAGATDARDRDIALARFNADGTKDTSFGTDGVVTLDLSTGVANGSSFVADSVWGLARYDDDRLVLSGGQVRAGGTDSDFALVRLNADGTRDSTFGMNGVFNLDTQFGGANDNASSRSLTILPGTDGIVGAGYRPAVGADTAPVLYKVTDGGVLDTTFGTNGVFSEQLLAEQTECYQAVVQPKDGGGYDLVTTGYGRALSTETTDFVSLRVSSEGVLDTTYGDNGLVRVDIGGFGDNSRRLTVLPDRRILLIGGGRLTSADVDGIVMLLTPDGAPDTSFAAAGFRSFNLGGPADFLWSVALSPDLGTAAIAGIRGVGSSPIPPSANDDAALVLMPLPK